MATPTKLMKTKWHPNPHDLKHSWTHGIESGVSDSSTIYPVIMYDEGLGAPSALKTNPENASFVQSNAPNVFVGSRIDNVISQFVFSLTKAALETDKIHALKVGVMPIFTAFINDYIAIDELTSLEIQDILELQTESTDRQGFPLYNSVKMDEAFANSSLLAATVPGLAATQKLEAVTFQLDAYYDMLHFQTTSEKLRSVSGGMHWMTLTKDKPIRTWKMKLRSKVKRANPFTFFGLLIHVPAVGSFEQIAQAGEVTDLQHLQVSTLNRYNEWNQEFNFSKV